MATTEDKTTALDFRTTADTAARALGHDLHWTLGRHSLRRGFPYHFLGRCRDCGAQVMADAGGASCPGDRDVRVERCELTLMTARRTR